eukprot:8950884-Prorocentrum_lima.AAC.1
MHRMRRRRRAGAERGRARPLPAAFRSGGHHQERRAGGRTGGGVLQEERPRHVRSAQRLGVQ